MSNRQPEDAAVALKKSQFFVSRLTPSQPGALGIVGLYGARACPTLKAYFHGFKGTSIESLAIGCIAVGQWHHEFLTGREGVRSLEREGGQRVAEEGLWSNVVDAEAEMARSVGTPDSRLDGVESRY